MDEKRIAELRAMHVAAHDPAAWADYSRKDYDEWYKPISYLNLCNAADEALPELLDLAAEALRLREDMAWIRGKLKLPADTEMFKAGESIAGALHVMESDAHGYKAYIAAYKCDDKQGEIARLTRKLVDLEAEQAVATAEVADSEEILRGSLRATTQFRWEKPQP